MRNLFAYLSITLLCLGNSTVLSQGIPEPNNYGTQEWGHRKNSNAGAGVKFTDEWYKAATGYHWPLTANANTKTTLDSIPIQFHLHASWRSSGEVICNSNFYRGEYSVSAEIIVDGVIEDVGYGSMTAADIDLLYGYVREFEGNFKDKAKAYHSETKIGPDAAFPHPAISASDCRGMGRITAHAYDSNMNATRIAHAHIPW